MTNAIDTFSAGASALGYIYQVRYALLEAVRRLRAGTDFSVAFETLDDVVFEKSAKPPDLLQTKHHVERAANLTDASPDLWKSIRVWAELMAANKVPPGSTRFLITTAVVGDGSAAKYLVATSERDEEKALERLRSTAQTSTNKVNEAAYASYNALSIDQQRRLIETIRILDRAPSVEQTLVDLAYELALTVERKHVASLAARLDGWWLHRAVIHLTDGSAKAILAHEIEAEMALLRESFKQESLPIDPDIVEAQVDLSAYDGRIFVHQLKLIELGAKRILFAVRDFYRAYEQRSRWMREELLYVGELDRYERLLIEEWERHFERMQEELGTEATAAAKVKAAKALYGWVETEANMPIRPSCTEVFITRGTFQMLAENQRLGWHPDFASRLAEILAKLGAA